MAYAEYSAPVYCGPMSPQPLPLHEAIAAAIDGRCTQTELAERLGIGQSNISKWVRGVARPSLEDLGRIEEAVGRPRGFVLMSAGYVECPTNVTEALERDAGLDDLGRAIVLAAYESARSNNRR